MVITDRQKFKVSSVKGDIQFKVMDVREGHRGHINSCSVYGLKEAAMITGDGDNCFKEWENAPVLKTGDKVYFNGFPLVTVVINPNASDGVRFVEPNLYEAIRAI